MPYAIGIYCAVIEFEFILIHDSITLLRNTYSCISLTGYHEQNKLYSYE